MHRLLAAWLMMALGSLPGVVSPLHIHRYADHDHPSHHHGIAAHEHGPRVLHHADDAAPHFEPCGPGDHMMSLVLGLVPAPEIHVADAPSEDLGVAGVLIPLRSILRFTDIRVHGPPLREHTSPRAPPPIALA